MTATYTLGHIRDDGNFQIIGSPYGTYTLGYYRDDGDFQIVATVNNQEAIFGADGLHLLITGLLTSIHEGINETAYCYAREDAADIVPVVEAEEWDGFVGCVPAVKGGAQ